MFCWLVDFFSSFFPKLYSTSILSFSFDCIIHSFLPYTSSSCELTMLHHQVVVLLRSSKTRIVAMKLLLSISLLNVWNQFVYTQNEWKKKLFSEYSSRHSLDENDDDHVDDDDEDDNDECFNIFICSSCYYITQLFKDIFLLFFFIEVSYETKQFNELGTNIWMSNLQQIFGRFVV